MARAIMPAAERTLLRCAIYTRKSTEDGLEQEFNSLDAQREACAAYILSQRHEGWILVPGHYDDGGYSGGSMERPGLRQLLAEVEAGRVDVIVVYKVDRLTRSLADFARIVDILDKASASFVSVTQAFNTTSSMGRLTLNVLLSFAQFEREVTGERIRDKIAASKRKGLWMGGNPSLGYDVADRKLVVNAAEAAQVETLFRLFEELGTIAALQMAAQARGLLSKSWVTRDGVTKGGVPFTRGALAHLLQNRLYLGEVHHKGQHYPGAHQAIIEADLFQRVQQRLAQRRVDRKLGTNASEPSLLAGLVSDEQGRRMMPSHACKGSRRYRYYVSQSDPASAHPPLRVPAGELERLVVATLIRELATPALMADLLEACATDTDMGYLQNRLARTAARLAGAQPHEQRGLLLALVPSITLSASAIVITLDAAALAERPLNTLSEGSSTLALTVPARLVRTGKEVRLILPSSHPHDISRHDPALIRFIVKAHAARKALDAAPDAPLDQIATAFGVSRDYLRVLIRTSYLAPDITAAIIDGHQPGDLTRQKLARIAALPIHWTEQRMMLGFG